MNFKVLTRSSRLCIINLLVLLVAQSRASNHTVSSSRALEDFKASLEGRSNELTIDDVTVDESGTFQVVASPQPSTSTNQLCFITYPLSEGEPLLEPEPGVGPQTVPNRPATWTYEFYGPDPQKDCGVRITGATSKDNGAWGIRSDVGSGGFTVEVRSPPDSIAIEGINAPNNVYEVEYEENSPGVNISCIARNANPAPTFTWSMAGESLNLTYFYEPIETNGDDGAYDYESILTYFPMPSHNNKELTCEIYHPVANSETPTSAEVTIMVLSRPDPYNWYVEYDEDQKVRVGEVVDLAVVFTSNPPPYFMQWDLPGLSEPLTGGNVTTTTTTMSSRFYRSSTMGRYTTDYSTSESVYKAKLTIDPLEEEDLDNEFNLLVENEMGSSNYTFRIQPYEGLSGGAIAGIVIGSVVGVILLAVLAFFGYKKFRKAKAKKKMKARQQERREERNEETGDGLENRGVDIDLGSVASSES